MWAVAIHSDQFSSYCACASFKTIEHILKRIVLLYGFTADPLGQLLGNVIKV